MKFKNVVITRRGGPEVLQVVENDLRDPAPGEVRVKILATGVSLTDVIMRRKIYPFALAISFAPGYEIVGIVDALGQGVTRFAEGDRVTAITVHGGYAEYIYLGAEHLLHVPEALDTVEVAALPLNYVTAYQVMHRVAKVKAGDKVLITGASGGVGTAFLQLGKLASLTMYGTASASNHDLLTEYGAVPIDYKTQDFVKAVRAKEPEGVDFAFDSVSRHYIRCCFQVLRRGGKLVEIGNHGLTPLLIGFVKLFFLNWLPNGRSAEFYGITLVYRRDKRPFMEDMQILFKLLAEGKIKPVILKKLPLLEAAQANELLEAGGIRGKIVLVAPELL